MRHCSLHGGTYNDGLGCDKRVGNLLRTGVLLTTYDCQQPDRAIALAWSMDVNREPVLGFVNKVGTREDRANE